MSKKVNHVVKSTLAGTLAGLGVLTNPFRETRKSFSRRYHGTMTDLLWMKIYNQVKACPKCRDLTTKMYKAGTSTYGTYSGTYIDHDTDSHCPEHWDAVATYQRHYVRH